MTADQPVPQIPPAPTPIPPVRQPVTGADAAGYPDGTRQNELGAKPVGKEGA